MLTTLKENLCTCWSAFGVWNGERLRAWMPGVVGRGRLVGTASAARFGNAVHRTSAVGGLARLQCLKVTRIGSSETGTCKDLHEQYSARVHTQSSHACLWRIRAERSWWVARSYEQGCCRL